MNDGDRKDAAAALAAAEVARVAVPPLTETYPQITVEDAYRIQLLNVESRVDAGARICGHKIGLTALAMQRYFNINEPDYGHLMDDMFIFEGREVSVERFIAPQVECELAFVLGRRLQGPNVNVADAARAVEFAMPSIEIIDSRIVDWRLGIQDTIADNGSSGAAVLGGRCLPLSDFDPRAVQAELCVNGHVVESGSTRSVFGNPLTVVAWLANTLAPFGIGLEEGHVVMTGSATIAVPVEAGMSIEARLGAFGNVQVQFV